MNQIVEKIKNHWKSILLIIICFMYVGSCTKSCNKGNELRIKDSIIASQDSTILSLSNELDSLNNELKIKDVIIDQKTQNVNNLVNANKKITVKIDTVKRK